MALREEEEEGEEGGESSAWFVGKVDYVETRRLTESTRTFSTV